jgi:P-type conjugative transfer protein TrbJ
MTSNRSIRRWPRFAAAAALVATLFALPLPQGAIAGFPVIDASNLAQNILSVTNSFKQIMHQVTQLQHLVTQINNQVRALKTIGSSSFGTLSEQLVDQMSHMNRLLGELTVIKYRTDGIKGEFDALFPKNSSWKEVSSSSYATYAAKWHQEVLQTSLTAMDAQSRLTQLLKRNNEIQKLLGQSQGADGVVRQLQLVNELLATVAGQMADFSSALITTGRLTATATASQASGERMTQEASRRARQNYTSRGKPPKRLPSLPSFGK